MITSLSLNNGVCQLKMGRIFIYIFKWSLPERITGTVPVELCRLDGQKGQGMGSEWAEKEFKRGMGWFKSDRVWNQ